MIVRVPLEDEARGRGARARPPALERRRIRVAEFVVVVHPVVEGRPATEFLRRRGGLGLVAADISRVDRLQVMRGPIDQRVARSGEGRQEAGIGPRPRVANGDGIQDVHGRRLAVDQQELGRPAGAEVPVVGDVFPVVAEILRGEGLSVRPAVPLAQGEGEASAVDRDRQEQVGLQIEVGVVADEARVAVDGEVADIPRLRDQRADRAAAGAEFSRGGGGIDDERGFGRSRRKRIRICDTWSEEGCRCGCEADQQRAAGYAAVRCARFLAAYVPPPTNLGLAQGLHFACPRRASPTWVGGGWPAS